MKTYNITVHWINGDRYTYTDAKIVQQYADGLGFIIADKEYFIPLNNVKVYSTKEIK